MGTAYGAHIGYGAHIAYDGGDAAGRQLSYASHVGYAAHANYAGGASNYKPEHVQWQYLVNWDDLADFDYVAHDVTGDVLTNNGVTAQRGLDKVRVLSPPAAGQAQFELDNESKRYSPENQASDLYGKLAAGHRVRIRMAELWMQATNAQVSGDAYRYVDLLGVAGVGHVIHAGDQLSYEVYMLDEDAQIAPVLLYGDGSRSTGTLDQHGLPLDPATDLSSFAYRQWYRRVATLDAADVGKTVSAIQLAAVRDDAGTFRARIRNLKLTTWDGTAISVAGSDVADPSGYGDGGSANFTDWWVIVPSLFGGVLDDLQQKPKIADRSVVATSLGVLSLFKNRFITTDLHTAIDTGGILNAALDAAGWSASERDIATGDSTAGFWWAEDEDASQKMIEAQNTEGPGALLYENGKGWPAFRNRNFSNVLSSSAQALFGPDGPLYVGADFDYSAGLKDIVNDAAISVVTRAWQATAAIWSAGADITVAAGATETIVAVLGDPARNIVAPVAGTDYTVTAGAVTSVTATQTGAAELTVAITAGGAGATITGLQVRGQTLKTMSTRKIHQGPPVGTAITRNYPLKTLPDIDVNTATDFVAAVVGLYGEPRPIVTIPVDGGANDDLLWQAGSLEIGTRVNVSEPQTALDFPVQIQQLRYSINAAGELMLLAGGERLPATGEFMQWDAGQWDSSQWGF